MIGMAMTDSLTGIANRRGFYRIGDKRFRTLTSNATPFSRSFDLDKFKPINDLWGHAEGDEVLKPSRRFWRNIYCRRGCRPFRRR